MTWTAFAILAMFCFPGSEVSGRPLPKGENALHWTLQEKRDQFQAKINYFFNASLLIFPLPLDLYF